MDFLTLSTGVVWVEVLTVLLAKYVFVGSAIKEWYTKFQGVAVLSDYLSVMIGVLLGKFLLPKMALVHAALIVQIVHDILFNFLILSPMPVGHNMVIDLLKKYAKQSTWYIILYDSFMIASSVLLGQSLASLSREKIILLLLVGMYALTYAIYTR
jgi:hypothetical protein